MLSGEHNVSKKEKLEHDIASEIRTKVRLEVPNKARCKVIQEIWSIVENRSWSKIFLPILQDLNTISKRFN